MVMKQPVFAKASPAAACFVSMFASICYAFTSIAVQAQTSVSDKLQVQKSELQTSKQREGQLTAQKKQIETELSALNEQLIDTGQDVQNTEQRLTELEEKLKKLGVKETRIRKKLAIENKSISKLLAAAQRMGRNPPPVIVTRRSDALSMVRSGMQLRYLFPKFQGEIKELREELFALMSVRRETKRAQENTLKEDQRLKTEQTRLAALIETKKASFVTNRQDLKKVRQAAKNAARQIDSLNERIAKNDKAVADNTKLGAYDRKKAEAAKAAERALADAKSSARRLLAPAKPVAPQLDIAGRLTQPNTGSQTSLIRIAPVGPGRAASPGRLEPAIPFQLAKARLPFPARGPRVINFGDTTPRGGRSKGIVIKTRHGAAVTSPCDGWVVYAGAFRSYGQLLIINAGGGYHVLLANLSRLDVELGQFVLAAEPVGAMAGVSRGSARPTDPVLYIEFRKNGKPIDPKPWWIKNNKNRIQS